MSCKLIQEVGRSNCEPSARLLARMIKNLRANIVDDIFGTDSQSKLFFFDANSFVGRNFFGHGTSKVRSKVRDHAGFAQDHVGGMLETTATSVGHDKARGQAEQFSSQKQLHDLQRGLIFLNSRVGSGNRQYRISSPPWVDDAMFHLEGQPG